MRRLVFTIDDEALERLQRMTASWGKSSIGEAVGESLRIAYDLQHLAEDGFVELFVRNPTDGAQERISDLMPRRQGAESASVCEAGR